MSYEAQLAAAQSMLSRKGAECTWRQVQQNSNSSEPWKEDAVTHTDHTVYVVFLPFDSTARRMLGYANDDAVPLGTMVGYMPGQTFIPTLSDQIIVGSKTYSVKSIDTINPDMALDLLYVLELRR